ncbi:MAG: hypothetical protein EHM46_00895 [Bacteroidetes bacterium]|nr:MAG: hypothetical protein EHM46_00895 [Bacteroidota bacterium]
MTRIIQRRRWIITIPGLFLCGITTLHAQYNMPQELDTASLRSQLNYIENRTRIYDDFRAIREDLFQKMKENIEDTLMVTHTEIEQLNRTLVEKNQQITGLNSDLETIRGERDDAIRNRDSFSFLGIKMNKAIYNSIMWFMVLGLAVLAVLLFLLFKRSHDVTAHKRKELEITLEEFEEYRKSSREKYEKMVVNHHNEMMKLKRS